MGKVYESIEERLTEFISAQHLFFVATAPSGPTGHVNLSPKGGDSLRILDEHTVAYVDFVGSGIETAAHVRENGRITVMLCAFEGPPKILRLYGRGEVIEPSDDRFESLRAEFPAEPPGKVRALIVVHVERIADSCGYAVPRYEYAGERTQLDDWVERKGTEVIDEYQRKNNARSLDGLPGLRWVETDDTQG